MEMDIKNLSVEQFIELKKKMDEAEKDTTPYLITDEDDGLQIVGDPNKIERKKKEYSIKFSYPNTDEVYNRLSTMNNCEITERTDNYIFCTRTFKDVWVYPIVYTAIQTAFMELYSFLVAITDEGGIRDMSEREMIESYKMLDQEMVESMCHAVATTIGLPKEEEICMIGLSVMPVIFQICDDFPEIINGADFFTEKSSETDTKVL